ncbi:uncharacterized protein K444DRAFT_374198 [Hyaloscypha bicolor E]|uniref:Dynein light chain n=1 Tax=Hyaloscypha bicolor E TaxID=1095630 RepID=A0A2J6TEZ6_9HELO|nr:uncharacterized protein K444DRAFT_374198 [Hyaloscypha bicolor E]PMD61597.1 hypothetical protein K444DRAFT_374198 [Hyaloscypha bicolor E]
MQQEAIDTGMGSHSNDKINVIFHGPQLIASTAQEAMAKFSIEKDIAMHIKKTFDERKGPTWHCIVGRNFGSFVTHETKHFIYFYLGHYAILLFKTQ